jgi:hypothetical protein
MGRTTSKRKLTMTMPDERTLSLLQTGRSLRELRADESLPDRVRKEANRLLRHYPIVNEFRLLAKIEASFKGSNLLTPDFGESWLKGYPCGRHDKWAMSWLAERLGQDVKDVTSVRESTHRRASVRQRCCP